MTREEELQLEYIRPVGSIEDARDDAECVEPDFVLSDGR